jgi:hypothetical protein
MEARKREAPLSVRLSQPDRSALEQLAAEITRERAVTEETVSINEAVRTAIHEALEARRPVIDAEERAWSALLTAAGSAAVARLGRTPDDPMWDDLVRSCGMAARLTLHGEPVGEPLPETHVERLHRGRTRTVRVPPRWPELRVTASIDDVPMELPLLVENDPRPGGITASVFLTDDDRQIRLYLSSLSRLVVPDRPIMQDKRLYSIADRLGFSDTRDAAGE